LIAVTVGKTGEVRRATLDGAFSFILCAGRARDGMRSLTNERRWRVRLRE
jgi:hypothetical protein